MRIGIFDSGVGGLTVLKKLIEKYPNNEYIYYGDTLNAPYGDKTIIELEKLSSRIVEFLIKRNVDIIIIACGTISSTLTKTLCGKYKVKIVDIISPTLAYINNSNYKNIGIMATRATVNSNIFKNNINKPVKQVCCPNFVPIIESRNFSELKYYIPTYLEELNNCDLIVLGCTHYPIIKDYITNYLENVKLLDMSECLNIAETSISTQKVDLYFSKLDKNIMENIECLLKSNINSINEK